MIDPLSAILTAGSGILNYVGAHNANETNASIAQQNIALQREFAQNGISWRVRDAQRSGIHPLYALGASTTSFSPVSVGAVNEMSGVASSLQSMGQDVSRAAAANRSPTDRVAAVATTQELTMNNLRLENAKLQNDILRNKVSQLNSGQLGPGGPEEEANLLIPGQKNTAGINPEPMKIAPAGSAPSGEAGAIADMGWSRTSTGWAPIPSKDVKERIEDNLIQEGMHAYRNNILPSFGHNLVNPPFKAPSGQEWWFNTLRQEYQLWPLGQRPTMGHRVPERR